MVKILDLLSGEVIGFKEDSFAAAVLANSGSYILEPVQNIAALAAIDISAVLDKTLVLAEDAGLFRYDLQSVLVANGVTVIAPTVGSGKWIKISTIITDHNLLSNVQGGSAMERYHLTQAQYNIASDIGAVELTFTNKTIDGGTFSA
jgi:hypothetical protein